MKLVTMTVAAVAAVIASGGLAAPGRAQQITGAGSTFAAPIYAKWGEAAKAAVGVELNYQSIGSGAGQNQILNRTVDFGASDAPMPSDKLTSGNLLQFPSVMGALVAIVNLPGVQSNQIKLTGELLADIYLGKIRKWNDPRLVELNGDVKLPSTAIAPVYRADGSGTTYVYTSYLSAVSPEWKTKVGAATSVRWVAGNGARGNEGVSATVRQVKGGIGYVEFAYAEQNKLTTTLLRNKNGEFVAPTPETFKAAADSGDWAGAKDFAISLIDLSGAKAWPIVSATFVLLPKDPKDATHSANVIKFFDWAFAHGADIASSLDYVPLPAPVQDAVRSQWHHQIKG